MHSLRGKSLRTFATWKFSVCHIPRHWKVRKITFYRSLRRLAGTRLRVPCTRYSLVLHIYGRFSRFLLVLPTKPRETREWSKKCSWIIPEHKVSFFVAVFSSCCFEVVLYVWLSLVPVGHGVLWIGLQCWAVYKVISEERGITAIFQFANTRTKYSRISN